jgi:hypothetical protein
MSWVIYLNFLSVGKFVLIEYLTLNYVFPYLWNVIWLLYQLIIHACSEAIFREKYFSADLPPLSDFQSEASKQTISCVRTHAAQISGRLSDKPRHVRSYRMLTWQQTFGQLSTTSGRIPYRLKIHSFPLRRTNLSFYYFSLEFLSFWFVSLVSSHKFSASAYFVLFCIFLSIPGIMLYLLWKFEMTSKNKVCA